MVNVQQVDKHYELFKISLAIGCAPKYTAQLTTAGPGSVYGRSIRHKIS